MPRLLRTVAHVAVVTAGGLLALGVYVLAVLLHGRQPSPFFAPPFLAPIFAVAGMAFGLWLVMVSRRRRVIILRAGILVLLLGILLWLRPLLWLPVASGQARVDGRPSPARLYRQG